ncbi:hypothetical protein TELCIR_00459 [Teladorsagia circumcincta]|uniref:Uncharacterized protein n=1 Tax=Teladorsagia circumcincta TaxID=45464 RepID=A0A2G9V4L4_TELCI|nr:hypothetical protein TELCIR_00459 [Teladorsagia circumcincta]
MFFCFPSLIVLEIKAAITALTLKMAMNYTYALCLEAQGAKFTRTLSAGCRSDDELDYEDGLCDNCGEECNTLHTIDDVKLCYVCRVYYKYEMMIA